MLENVNIVHISFGVICRAFACDVTGAIFVSRDKVRQSNFEVHHYAWLPKHI